MKARLFAGAWLIFFSSSLLAAPGPEPFKFQPNEVVVLTGAANMERTRFNGYLQTLLIAAQPEVKLRVRNLGWEGDTVFEQWRDAGASEPWKRTRDWEKLLNDAGANVVIAQFGQMETLSPATNFASNYEALLDQFKGQGRRVVVISPMPFEQAASKTLPDLTKHNPAVLAMSQGLRAMAARKGFRFIDLYAAVNARPKDGRLLTDNGYHLNERGHAVVAEIIVKELGLNPKPLAQLEKVRTEVIEMERLWFNFWRPMNWSFLEGDRTHVQFSRDWNDQNIRLFPDEMKEYVPLLAQADENVWLALAGQPTKPIPVRSSISVEAPPTPPQTPDQELATLKIDPHYQVNLFASEKDGIVKPIRMTWDERGRLWVAGTPSYPQLKPGEKPNDKIIICEDTNGDGRADKFTTYADGLFMPLGLAFGDGGVYVCHGTELWHFKDTNGDDCVDEKRIVLGGFGTADSHQMINSSAWGFGGEMWLTQGHHIYSRVETPYGVEKLNRAGVFRLRPRTLRLDTFFQHSSAGQNDWGVITDDYGQVFHKSGATVGAYYSVPGMIRSELALDSEVMRFFKTRAKHVGFDIIGSKHFPDELQGCFVLGGFYDNTLQLHQLEYTNSIFRSRPLPHIIETTNSVFRPVDVHLGPDGAIYFADWYNPIIGHYQASYRHPDRDQGHGRIWRVTYKGRPTVKPPQLAGASTEELFKQLGSSERWVKAQAKRLLYDQDTAKVTEALDRWVGTLKPGTDEYLRLQALSVYESLDMPRKLLLEQLLRAEDFRVRSYATRVIGSWGARVPGVLDLLAKQVADEHPRVRLEAVVASSYLKDPLAVGIVLRVLEKPMDSYLDHALLKCVDAMRPLWKDRAHNAEEFRFAKDEHWLYLLKNGPVTNAAGLIRSRAGNLTGEQARPWLVTLAAVGQTNDLRFVLSKGTRDPLVLDALIAETQVRKLAPEGEVAADLESLLSGSDVTLQTRAIRLAGLWKVNALTNRLETIAVDEKSSSTLRGEAFGALVRLRGKAALPLLKNIFENSSTNALALGALEAVARASLPDAARLAVERVGTAKNAAEAALWLRPVLQSKGGYGALVGALQAGKLAAAPAKLALVAVNNSGSYNKNLVERLSALAGFSATLPAYSPEYIREVAEASKKGNAAEGRKVYDTLGCAACHVVNGEGGKLGPDLSALGRGLPLEGIVAEVIWPQLNVKEGFESSTITTRDGRFIEGFKQSETTEEITIRDTLGEVTRIRRSQVEAMRTGGTVMPEGLTAPLSKQQLADLITFLSGLGK